MDSSSLTTRCREILLGSLLGDGSLRIHTPYRNARFAFRHSLAQQEYFGWKVSELQEISSEHCVWQQEDAGYGKYKLRYQSRALPVLTELYALTHKYSRLHFRSQWLRQLTPLSLAIWWFDDGSLIGNSRKGVLCTDGFNRHDVTQLGILLKSRWGIDTTVAPAGKSDIRKNYHRLWLPSTKEVQKFLRLIFPYTPKAMLSKVVLLYQDAQLQQRWISEVARITQFPHTVVEQAVYEKRQRWKMFRE